MKALAYRPDCTPSSAVPANCARPRQHPPPDLVESSTLGRKSRVAAVRPEALLFQPSPLLPLHLPPQPPNTRHPIPHPRLGSLLVATVAFQVAWKSASASQVAIVAAQQTTVLHFSSTQLVSKVDCASLHVAELGERVLHLDGPEPLSGVPAPFGREGHWSSFESAACLPKQERTIQCALEPGS